MKAGLEENLKRWLSQDIHRYSAQDLPMLCLLFQRRKFRLNPLFNQVAGSASQIFSSKHKSCICLESAHVCVLNKGESVNYLLNVDKRK